MVIGVEKKIYKGSGRTNSSLVRYKSPMVKKTLEELTTNRK